MSKYVNLDDNQPYVKINGYVIPQPDEGLGYSFETTYSSDSGRVQSGVNNVSPLFTVESLSYSKTGLSASEMSNVLRLVAHGRTFTLYYFSPYYGCWREAPFYVGKGSLSVGRLNLNDEEFESLKFNMIGVNPI